MMRKFCMLLALLLAMCIPALAEDVAAEMALLLEGDWVHEHNAALRLLFDGENGFYYDAQNTFYYGHYAYQGNGEYRLIDDVGEEHILSIYDDNSLGLEGVEGYFYCGYRYLLVDFPETDESAWLSEDGLNRLVFSLDGDFEFENEDTFLYGEYVYLGGGDYQLNEAEGGVYAVSLYTDGSVSMEGVEGYFWRTDEAIGEPPFDLLADDSFAQDEPDGEAAASLLVNDFDTEPIALEGTWYKFANADAMPFVLDGDSYFCENAVFGSESSGAWMLDEIVLMVEGEETAPSAYISMEAYDGMSPGWNPVPLAGNRILCSNAWDVWFLHEGLMGTAEGEQLIRLAQFLCADWWHMEDGGNMSVDFSCMGNAVVFASFNSEGGSEIIGSWAFADDAVIVSLADGETVTIALPAESFTLGGVAFSQF